MFHTILVPTDGSELAEKAVRAAVEFAKAHQGKVFGLSVAEPYPSTLGVHSTFRTHPETYDKDILGVAQANVQKVADAANEAGVPCQTLAVLAFEPAEEIVKAAAERGCDVIFIASHGRRGMSRLLLGSVTQKVLELTSVPVLVFR